MNASQRWNRMGLWLWDALLFILAIIVMGAPVEYFFRGVILEPNTGIRIYHLLVIIATPLLALMLWAMHKAEGQDRSKDAPLPPGVMPPSGWPSLRRLQGPKSGEPGIAVEGPPASAPAPEGHE